MLNIFTGKEAQEKFNADQALDKGKKANDRIPGERTSHLQRTTIHECQCNEEEGEVKHKERLADI